MEQCTLPPHPADSVSGPLNDPNTIALPESLLSCVSASSSLSKRCAVRTYTSTIVSNGSLRYAQRSSRTFELNDIADGDLDITREQQGHVGRPLLLPLDLELHAHIVSSRVDP